MGFGRRSENFGKTKWAQISKNLNGRNENNVKSRYFPFLGLRSISARKSLIS